MNIKPYPTEQAILGLHIRNVPDWVAEELEAEARDLHRSRQAHIRALLVDHAKRHKARIEASKIKQESK